jgi:hypothetical protein
MTNRADGRTGELNARAAIQRGETGDKIPGFDPAAAPMETDAEAGGAPYGGAADIPSGKTARPPETSAGTAMRSYHGHAQDPGHSRRWLSLVIAAVVTVLLAGSIMAIVA